MDNNVLLEVDKKGNTTSSIQATSTISAPNQKTIINAVASIIHNLLEEWEEDMTMDDQHPLWAFCEEKQIVNKPEYFTEARLNTLRAKPEKSYIQEFIKALQDCAKFSIECCIITLVYINRVVNFTSANIAPTVWRPLLLSCLLVSQKVWDDRQLSNSDFAFIQPFFETREITQLEQKLLECLEQNVIVNNKIQNKYQLELRSMFEDDEKEFPLEPLSNDKMHELKKRSEMLGETEKEKEEKKRTTTTITTQEKTSHDFIIN